MTEDVKAREGSNSFGHVSVIKPFNVSEKFAKKSDLVCNGSTIPSKGRRARFAIPVFACNECEQILTEPRIEKWLKWLIVNL